MAVSTLYFGLWQSAKKLEIQIGAPLTGVNRRHPLNRKIIGSNLSEARNELNKLLMKIEAGALHEAELQVGLLHAYHHLNFAWNVRRVATSRYASLTQREFETWGKYPSDIETFGE